MQLWFSKNPGKKFLWEIHKENLLEFPGKVPHFSKEINESKNTTIGTNDSLRGTIEMKTMAWTFSKTDFWFC